MAQYMRSIAAMVAAEIGGHAQFQSCHTDSLMKIQKNYIEKKYGYFLCKKHFLPKNIF
jgi:hypothetical protein